MKTLSKLLVSILFAIPAHAQEWSDLANGEHSFKSLGPGFYQEVPVRRIKDAKVQLAFVNTQLVEKLGLKLPGDPAEVERMLTDLFGWEVDPEKKSEKTWFATHYLDANEKKVGGAIGDGRALWTGELKLKTTDGKTLYIDGVQKGVGATPFAWTDNPTHKDGIQNTNELIVSGVRSMADQGNNLDSTGDVLGFTIQDADGKYRSMTLRLGRQTRPAHIRYHSDTPDLEKKMTDYIVKRDLGLPIETSVTDQMFLEWQRQFTINNAEETARVFALQGFFEHPTAGNKTTTGGSIDLNGRQYLDAYHVNMHHLYGRLKVGEQVSLQRRYISQINNYLRDAKYRLNVNTNERTKELNALFDQHFKNTASKLFLMRLGLSPAEIRQLDPKLRLEFYRVVDQLMRAEGTRPVDMKMHNDAVVPAAFDTRKILKGTMAAIAKLQRDGKPTALNELYKVDWKWATLAESDYALPDTAYQSLWSRTVSKFRSMVQYFKNGQVTYLGMRNQYESTVQKIIKELGGQIKPTWIASAAIRTDQVRFDNTTDGVWDEYIHPIRHKAEAFETSWVEISRLMEESAKRFVDSEQPGRTKGMLWPTREIRNPEGRAALREVVNRRLEAIAAQPGGATALCRSIF